MSEACACAMALGARKITGSSLAMATTGLAGPGGGMDGTPVGTVFIAVGLKRRSHLQRTLLHRQSGAHSHFIHPECDQ